MKVGSLVVVIRPINAGDDLDVVWLPVGDNETIYTVRGIDELEGWGEPGVTLEEGVVGYDASGTEIGIAVRLFREVQPPEELSISALMEEVNEIELFQV